MGGPVSFATSRVTDFSFFQTRMTHVNVTVFLLLQPVMFMSLRPLGASCVIFVNVFTKLW